MLGIHDAEHEETAPHAPQLVISELACSLAGTTQTVKIVPGTLVHRVYGKEEAIEQFRCSYGVNPAYRDTIEGGALRVAGIGPDGEIRILELSGHRFFIATLFLPQLSSSAEMPHPIVTAYLKTALAFKTLRIPAISQKPDTRFSLQSQDLRGCATCGRLKTSEVCPK